MAKIRIVHLKERGLYLRISHKRVNRFLSLEIPLSEKRWNPKQERVRKSKGSDEINTYLAKVESRAQEILATLSDEPLLTSDLIKEALLDNLTKSAPATDFLTYADSFIEGLRIAGRISYFKRCRNVIKKVRNFIKPRTALAFESVTATFLREFSNFLASEYGNNQNTIASDLGTIRTIFKNAVVEGHARQEHYPFFHVKVRKLRRGKPPLIREEFDAIRALDYEVGSHLWFCRQGFVFQVMTYGMRISDLFTLRPEYFNNGRLRYLMRKSRFGKPKTVDLLVSAPMHEILDRLPDPEPFVWPFLNGKDVSTPMLEHNVIVSETTLYNNALKQIASDAGIKKKLSTHVARYTFGKIAHDMGWGAIELQTAYQHSRLTTTQGYVQSFDNKKLDELSKDLF